MPKVSLKGVSFVGVLMVVRYARQIHNVLVTQKSNKKPRLEDLPVTFTEEDACKVFHPHDDALVVTMEIAGYSTRRVLIDNGSSADIIYLTAF